jgi:plasmid stabilization system protein ParE
MRVIFHRLARAEAKQIATYLHRQGPAKRARFVAAVDDAVARIVANPAAGSPAFGTFRWVRAGRFKYFLYYEVHSANLAEVFAVAHAGRRPGYWLRRSTRP